MRVVVYGSRPDGQAKVVSELAADNPELELVGLVDDFPENAGRTVRGLRILGAGSDLAALRDAHDVDGLLLGFGESRGRAKIVEMARKADYSLPRLIHPSARVCTSASLEDGVHVLAFAYIGPDVRVRSGALVNTGAIVEHDSTVEAGAVIGPAATLCGRVHVGSDATVGAGATVLPDVTIGARAFVGAGALVREDVGDGVLVAGVPARQLGAAG